MSAPPADRPQLRFDAFEAIAGTAARHDVVLELVGGELGVRPAPDGDHGQILAWLQRACVRQRPDLWLFRRQGLRLFPSHRAGAARPDGSLAPAVTVHSEPVKGRYREIRSYDYGERVELPGLDLTLDTEELKDYSR
ncbi:Uma2 family endonuclease [Kitasatospora purpeofusca]|uniref:hypothetical protein n=1 Tax=Kitasatospora purpeofusca TaxID=67352 RepID=UPI00324EA93C